MELTRKQWMMIVVIIVGTFVTVLNQTLVTPALPAIMNEMHIDASTGQWLTSGFTLVNAIMIPITAYLQDRFSVRRLFMFSMAIFSFGSLMCGWGPDFGMLLAGRLVQAAGAGILMPMAMTILLVMFPVERRGSAMGIFGLVISFAPAIGPTISGIMVDTASWHIMFYVIAAACALITICSAIFIEQAPPEGLGDAKLDPLSVILSTFGFGGMLYGFSMFGSYGLDPVSIVACVVGTVCVVWFFIRQTHLEVPMLRVQVLLNRKFLIATIIGMLVQASLFVAPVLVPIYVQNLMGYSAMVSGLVIMPGAIIMGLMNPIAGKIFDKRGARWLGIAGMALLFLTTLGFAFVDTSTNLFIIISIFGVRMLSLTLVNMPITTWGMNALDVKLMNHGTSINNTLRQVAGSLGTALVVSVYTGVQQYLGTTQDAINASMTAFNIAFMICSGLVLIGLILTIIFVKGKPGAINAKEYSDAKSLEIEIADESRDLLAKIMKRDVYVLHTDDTVRTAMQLFIDEGISACPVVDRKNNPAGFISDGDILKNLARESHSMIDPVALIAMTSLDKREYNEKLEVLMEKPISAICTSNFLSVDVHENIQEVCGMLAAKHLKKVPVMENGKIVGIVNRSDITRYSMEAYLEGKPQDVIHCKSVDDDEDCGCEPGEEDTETLGEQGIG